MSTDTMTQAEATTTTFTVTASAFTAGVEWGKASASTDQTLPVLTGILLEWGQSPDHYTARHGKRKDVPADGLTMVATDRFTLTWATMPFEGDAPEAGRVLLPAKELASIVKAWPKRGRGMTDNEVTVTVNSTPAGVPLTVTIECLVMGQPVATNVLRPVMGEFPQYRKLVPAFEDGSGSPAGLAFDAGKLSKLLTAAVKASGEKHAAVSLRAGGSPDTYSDKPIAIAVHVPYDHPVKLSGLLMPVRLAS